MFKYIAILLIATSLNANHCQQQGQVCGSNNVTYANACQCNRARVQISAYRPCAQVANLDAIYRQALNRSDCRPALNRRDCRQAYNVVSAAPAVHHHQAVSVVGNLNPAQWGNYSQDLVPVQWSNNNEVSPLNLNWGNNLNHGNNMNWNHGNNMNWNLGNNMNWNHGNNMNLNHGNNMNLNHGNNWSNVAMVGSATE